MSNDKIRYNYHYNTCDLPHALKLIHDLRQSISGSITMDFQTKLCVRRVIGADTDTQKR